MKAERRPTIAEEMRRVLYETREASIHHLSEDVVAIVWGEYVFLFDEAEYRSAQYHRLDELDDDWVDAVNFWCIDLARTERGKRAMEELAQVSGLSRNMPQPFSK